ncbi:rhomboid family intramembrane serine protease [Aquimarina algicola]|uniref:Rhomboid family intramembrane serine protease n=1 Tax=Aquimarina algicola TaxID=2589995 RepID=A0A504IZZ3_9FLAO|nr:rhomboid family intramembrane serine protease [Aquimarina algicola]TPN81328.1 rhomboid family intramembrane serine protease [Aquimarina algicola]
MKQDDDTYFKFNTGIVGYPLLFVLLIWIVFWFEVRFNLDLNHLGVFPRTVIGLRGILFSPFIHGDISHLWHNTLPLLILSSALFFFYQNNAWRVLVIGLFFTGLFTWLIGRSANHIGASGIIYMLFGFLFFKGIIARHFRLMALSFIVVFIYGSLVMYVLPIDPKISWEGHLSGIVTGTILAFVLKKGIAKPELYNWQSEDYDPEEDDFLKHFDENGNFIEQLPESDNLQDENILDDRGDIKVVYTYKEADNNKEE